MSQTFDRVFKHINKSKIDCLKRMRDVEANGIKANAMLLFDTSCMMINMALDAKTKSLEIR